MHVFLLERERESIVWFVSSLNIYLFTLGPLKLLSLSSQIVAKVSIYSIDESLPSVYTYIHTQAN